MESHTLSSATPSDAQNLEILNVFRWITQMMRVAARATEATTDLTTAQLFVLSKIAAKSGLSLNEVAGETHTHQSSVSVVVQRLVERGLVARSRSAHDARRLELRLTPRGRTKFSRAPDPVQNQLIEALGRLSADDRRALHHGLQRFGDALGVAHSVPAMFFEDESVARRRMKSRKLKAAPAGKAAR
jgi:DNA-binding MarR family transcriptional regulator